MTALAERRRGLTLTELLVVLVIIFILVAWVMPMLMGQREQDQHHNACRNNLKQIGLALHQYHDLYGSFPPAYTVDAEGRSLHSWRTLILPFVDQKPFYDTLDLTKPWDDPANAAARSLVPEVYRCPSAEIPAGFTTYLGVAAPGGMFEGTTSRQLDDVTDGTDRTLMVIEVAPKHAVHWMSPHDDDGTCLLGATAKTDSAHNAGFHVLLADGSVRYLSNDVSDEKRRGLSTVAGGEDVGGF